MGNLNLPVRGQEVDRFFGDLGIQRSFLLEAGKQLAHGTRIEQRAGEAMRADVARLLQQVDVFFGERRVGCFALCSSTSCDSRKAHAMPAGPPPTMTTSASITGRSTSGSGLRNTIMKSFLKIRGCVQRFREPVDIRTCRGAASALLKCRFTQDENTQIQSATSESS